MVEYIQHGVVPHKSKNVFPLICNIPQYLLTIDLPKIIERVSITKSVKFFFLNSGLVTKICL